MFRTKRLLRQGSCRVSIAPLLTVRASPRSQRLLTEGLSYGAASEGSRISSIRKISPYRYNVSRETV